MAARSAAEAPAVEGSRRERPGNRPSPLAATVAVTLSVLGSVFLLWPQHGRVLNWDEVDYLNAARMGVIANLWEQGSLSIPDYVRFSLDKLRGNDPRLPGGYEETEDPFKLRHGHSPGVVAAMVPTAGAESERGHRAVQMVGAIALTVALVVAYRLISTTWTWAGVLVILAVGPWFGWHLFRTIQFHGWTAVWLSLTVAFLSRWFTDGRPRSWGLALCASLALLILTLESSVFVLVGVVASLVIWVRGLGRRPREPWIRPYLLPGLLTVLAMTVAVWPGLVLKGGFLKMPAERYYQVFLGEGEVYFFNRSADLLAYLLPAGITAVTVGYLWATRRDDVLRWGPVVVVAGIYFASIVRFAVSDAYFLPAFAPLLVLFAWVVGDLDRRGQAAVAAGIVVVMIAGTATLVGTNVRNNRADARIRADIAYVGRLLGGDRGLFDGGHVWRHYLPGHAIEDVSYNADTLLVRRDGEYVDVPPRDYQGSVVGILRSESRSLFFDGAGARELTARCPRIDRPTVVLWDCRGFSP